MCIVANSGSLTREPTALLSARQPKPLQHLFVGIPLKRFALRFAEGQGQAGVVCGTVEEQVSQSRGTRGCRERGYNVSTSAGCGRGSSKTGQNWQLERGPSRQAAP